MIDVNDDATARLLRLSGPRAGVPAERAARVRRTLHGEWQARTRRRAAHQRVLAATALLAAAAAIVLTVRLTTRLPTAAGPSSEVVATTERIEGQVARQPAGDGGDPAATRLSPGDNVRIGEWVQTDATSRSAFRLRDGTSVRLDRGGRFRLLSPSIVELTRGTLYFDTGHASAGVEVRTPLGSVHDIGTQFEVRLQLSSLRLRVRTGVAELRRGSATASARAGTELTIGTAAAVTSTVATYGPDWEWTAGLAPAFEIEGRPLAAFLGHMSHEHGWTLRYSDDVLARDVSSIILHGSVSGLTPEEALAVALTTSGLAHRFHDGELIVSRSRQ